MDVGAIFIRDDLVYRLQIVAIQIAPLPNMLIYGMWIVGETIPKWARQVHIYTHYLVDITNATSIYPYTYTLTTLYY